MWRGDIDGGVVEDGAGVRLCADDVGQVGDGDELGWGVGGVVGWEAAWGMKVGIIDVGLGEGDGKHFGSDGAGAEDAGRIVGEREDGGLDAEAAWTGVEDEEVAEGGADVFGRGGADCAGGISAGCDEGAGEGADEIEGDGMIGAAECDGGPVGEGGGGDDA